jgi:hypothetical protein
MRIVFIYSHLGNTGTNVQLYYLLKGLLTMDIRHDLQIEIICFKYNDHSFIDKFCSDNGILVHRFGEKDRYFLFGYLKAFWNFRTFKFDRAISYGILSDLISLSNFRRNNYSYVHSTLRVNYIFRYGKLMGNFITFCHKIIYRSMTDVLSISESVKLNLDKEGISSKLVRNCFIHDYNSTIELFPRSNNSFATVSSKLPGKNIKYLCDFFKCRPDLRLLVYGACDLQNDYKYDNIIFKGHSNDLRSEFLKVKYFISSSLHEGLPNAVIEGLYSGCVAVLSSIPSHNEIKSLVESKNIILFQLDEDFLSLSNVMFDLCRYPAEPINLIQTLINKNLNSNLTTNQFLKAINYV